MKKERTFKEIVYIAGTKYEINDERVFKHYRLASQLVKDNNRIVGFANRPGFTKRTESTLSASIQDHPSI